MRILVTGREGQLARSLAERGGLHDGAEIIRAGRPDLDLDRLESIPLAIARAAPDVVVSAAAYTAVDLAEDEPARAMHINAEAAAEIARAAYAVGARLIHISTDYVYDGRKGCAYVEGDATAPQSVYGATKLEGERRVVASHTQALILRTSWVFSPFGKNFVRTMLDLAETRDSLRVVNDQHGSPTSALDLADAVLAIVSEWRRNPLIGCGEVYHAAGSGATTWCGLARHALLTSRALGGPFAEVAGIKTSEWPTKAARPANSQLDCSRFARHFGWRAPMWQQSVEAVVPRLLAARSGATP